MPAVECRAMSMRLNVHLFVTGVFNKYKPDGTLATVPHAQSLYSELDVQYDQQSAICHVGRRRCRCYQQQTGGCPCLSHCAMANFQSAEFGTKFHGEVPYFYSPQKRMLYCFWCVCLSGLCLFVCLFVCLSVRPDVCPGFLALLSPRLPIPLPRWRRAVRSSLELILVVFRDTLISLTHCLAWVEDSVLRHL